MADTLPQIRLIILHLLASNGGCYAGTMSLVDQIPADPRGVIRSLRECQHDQLITSKQSNGGRGHKSIHYLTSQAQTLLTQKGNDHVDRSK